jgi:archaellum component FlaF (FlaF/FlaG flagellin family)
MNRQRGQSAVEFALMAPIVFMMIFGMIWGGIMFMEYLHLTNFVRTAARQISVAQDTSSRQAIIDDYKANLTRVYNDYSMPEMYKPTITFNGSDKITDDDIDIVINVTLVMEDATYNSLPNILKSPEDVSYGIGFPPKSIKAIQYHMRLEKLANEETNDDQSDGNNIYGR